MGSNTTKRNLYKPAINEVGWGSDVNTNFDILDRLPGDKVIGAAVASEATLFAALGYPVTANYFPITGAVGITGISASGQVGSTITLVFGGILTLTHHSTNLILPGNIDITTFVGLALTFNEYAAGDWRLIGSSGHPGLTITIRGESRNLVIGAVTDNTVDIDADEIILQDVNSHPKRITSINVTVDTDTDWTTNGSVTNALGRGDGGVLTVSTWYYIWIVSGSTGTAAVVTTEGTLANVLTNSVSTGGEYDTYGALVGMIYSDGTSDLVAITQVGNRAQYVLSQTLLAAGSAVAYTSMAATLATMIPANAKTCLVRTQNQPDGTAAIFEGFANISADGTNSHYNAGYAAFSNTSPYQVKNQTDGEIVIVTAQTLWYKNGHANNDLTIHVVGFTI